MVPEDCSRRRRGPRIPFRTFTCTEEYPFVTFLTLRTTFDMVADTDVTVAVGLEAMKDGVDAKNAIGRFVGL